MGELLEPGICRWFSMTISTVKEFIRESSLGTLKSKVIQGSVWMMFLNVSSRLLQIVKLIVLAKILSPSVFGLMGAALLTLTVFRKMTSFGIDSSLIQNKQDISEHLDTAWSIKLIRSGLLAGSVFLLSDHIETLFSYPHLGDLLKVLSLSLALDGLLNPGIIYLKRELDFKTQFVYEFSRSVVDVIVAITAAILLQNVWAFVFGLLLGKSVQVGVSYLLVEYRPSLKFNRSKAYEILNFGKWVWLADAVVLLATSGDDVFVGIILTSSHLGFYQLSFRLSNTPATEISNVIASVLFPTYSRIQDERETLKLVFHRALQAILLLIMPMSIGLILVARNFTLVFLGESWTPVIPVIQVMAVAGFGRAIAATGGALFTGYGVPEWDFRMNLVRAVTIIITIYPMTEEWGIVGTAGSITAGIGMTLLIWLYKTKEITGLSMHEYLSISLIPLVGSLFMIPPVYFFSGDTIEQLILSIAFGITVYTVTVYGAFRQQEESPIDALLN